MKAYKVELLIIDHDDMSSDEVVSSIINARYANHCIMPHVMQIIEKDIGEWSDDHPLNKTATFETHYKMLFDK